MSLKEFVNDMSSDKTKIVMYRTHVAYIDREFLQEFDLHCGVVNFSAWIRKQALQDLNLTITNKEDLLILDDLVLNYYYIDKSEWLRDKMRIAIRTKHL